MDATMASVLKLTGHGRRWPELAGDVVRKATPLAVQPVHEDAENHVGHLAIARNRQSPEVRELRLIDMYLDAHGSLPHEIHPFPR